MCVGMCPRAECIIMNISEESEYEVQALKEEGKLFKVSILEDVNLFCVDHQDHIIYKSIM